MKRKEPGFTLIELVIVIACCALVSAAVITAVVGCIRVGTRTADGTQEQQTVRMVLELIGEQVRGGGKIRVDTDTTDTWIIYSGGTKLYQYENGAISTGGGTILLDAVESSEAKIEGNMLTLTITTGAGTYTAEILRRTGFATLASGGRASTVGKTVASASGSAQAQMLSLASEPESTYAARYEFLCTLETQRGSTGEVLSEAEDGSYVGSPDNTYCLWYSRAKGYSDYIDGWSKDTPWCAAFLSWALAQNAAGLRTTSANLTLYADVACWAEALEAEGRLAAPGDYDPMPGDLIFFDWTGDGTAQHVGAVLCVDDENGRLEIIEGNSGGAVRLSTVSPGDENILGYGILPWVPDGAALQ